MASSGGTMLALFEGEPRWSREAVGLRRVAFTVDGPGFVDFPSRPERLPLLDEAGRRLIRDRAANHGRSCPIYLPKPCGNRYGVTTHDRARVSGHLQA